MALARGGQVLATQSEGDGSAASFVDERRIKGLHLFVFDRRIRKLENRGLGGYGKKRIEAETMSDHCCKTDACRIKDLEAQLENEYERGFIDAQLQAHDIYEAESSKREAELTKSEAIIREVSGKRLQLWADACKDRDAWKAMAEKLAKKLKAVILWFDRNNPQELINTGELRESLSTFAAMSNGQSGLEAGQTAMKSPGAEK